MKPLKDNLASTLSGSNTGHPTHTPIPDEERCPQCRKDFALCTCYDDLADRDRLLAENAKLRSALDRLYNATATLLQSKPIHDMDEVFAEARAALKG